MSTTIQETIDRLRELDRTASPSPWSYNPWSANSSGEVTQDITCGWGEDEEILIGEVSCILYEHDAEMIAESRNAIPALIAEIERLKAENAKTWEDGYKFAANSYYDDISEPDDFAQEARANSPYKKEK